MEKSFWSVALDFCINAFYSLAMFIKSLIKRIAKSKFFTDFDLSNILQFFWITAFLILLFILTGFLSTEDHYARLKNNIAVSEKARDYLHAVFDEALENSPDFDLEVESSYVLYGKEDSSYYCYYILETAGHRHFQLDVDNAEDIYQCNGVLDSYEPSYYELTDFNKSSGRGVLHFVKN